VSLYPVVPGAGDVFAEDGLMIAVRLEDVASPLRNGALPGAGGVSALVVGVTERIRSGEAAVFCKVVAVAPAVVRRDGKVRAAGSPAGHARLGPLEKWLEDWAGLGVVEDVAGRAVLDPRFVKGKRERLLTRALMIRAIVLMTLMPDAGLWEAVLALPATSRWCRGRGRGGRRRSGRWVTGGTRSARARWKNCRPSCWRRPGGSTRPGAGGRPPRGCWRCARWTGR
jgi:hypothetical protein